MQSIGRYALPIQGLSSILNLLKRCTADVRLGARGYTEADTS